MESLSKVRVPRWLAYLGAGLVFAAVGAYLWTAHRQHLAGLLFFALALACPLMHLFRHGGHGHGGHGHGGPAGTRGASSSAPDTQVRKRLG